MDPYRRKINKTAEFLQNRLKDPPDIGLVTGSGLGDVAASMQVSTVIAYADIPYFPVTTVISHAGRLLAGRLQGRRLVVMQGRFHLYEGYSPLEVTYPIRVLQRLGVKHLIVTNAAGGLDTSFEAGDIMVISDHINLTGENPLVGLTDDFWGDRFPDMTDAYSRDLIDAALNAGKKNSVPLHCGVYAGIKGPSLETKAETRFLRISGADAVGFSTVQEVIAAVHAKIQVLGLSIITNVNDPDRPMPASVDEIISVANRTAPKVGLVIKTVVESLGG